MITYIALFRGINVGGNNSLPMKELVAILESLGMRKVKTYIQNGNAVFQSTEKDLSQISRKITAEIMNRHGFEPYLLILEFEEIKKAIEGNPFPEAETDSSNLHLGFLATRPESPNLEKLSLLKKESERFQLTDRNWRTVFKIMEMAVE